MLLALNDLTDTQIALLIDCLELIRDVYLSSRGYSLCCLRLFTLCAFLRLLLLLRLWCWNFLLLFRIRYVYCLDNTIVLRIKLDERRGCVWLVQCRLQLEDHTIKFRRDRFALL